jgi:transposase
VGYHFCKWSRHGSLERVWQPSLQALVAALDLRVVKLDGSQPLAKQGGEHVAYQGRKRAKTRNILPITDANGYGIATTGSVADNHHDNFDLKPHLQQAFKVRKRLGLHFAGAFFNADRAFDTKAARRVCFNHKVLPNLAYNMRYQPHPKRGRKRLFNATIYKQRFVSERPFAWIDKFHALLLRFDRKAAPWLAGHYLAYAMINLRHCLAAKA